MNFFRRIKPEPGYDRCLVGRSGDLQRIADELTRADGGKVVVVGSHGAGKSELVRGSIQRCLREQSADGESSHSFFNVDTNILSTDTIRIKEESDTFLDTVMKHPRCVLCIDDLSALLSTRNGRSGSLRRLIEVLSMKGVRFVGTITPEVLTSLTDELPELIANCTVVRLKSTSEEDTLRILRDVSIRLTAKHGIEVSSGAMRAAVELTERYMPDAALPGKAIEALEKATFRYTRKQEILMTEPGDILDPESMAHLGKKVSFYDVKRVVEELLSVDIDAHKAAEWTEQTAKALQKRVHGQNVAIERLATALAGVRVRFGRAGRPAGMILIAGPRGVGKHLAVKAMAETVLQSDADLIRYDMRDYVSDQSVMKLFGQTPERSGSNENSHVFRAIRDRAFTFIVFEHANEASKEALVLLETIASRGYLRDHQGHKVNFIRSVLVFLCETREWVTPDAESSAALFDFGAKLLPRSLVDHMDAVVPFVPLDDDARMQIVRDLVLAFQRTLPSPRPTLRLDKRVLSLLAKPEDGVFATENPLRQRAEALVFNPVRAFLTDNPPERDSAIVVTANGDDIEVRTAASPH